MRNILTKLNLLLYKKYALLIVILGIISLNSIIYLTSEKTNFKRIQSREDASGFSHDKAHKFIYFYYYKGYFPLATLNKNLEYSENAADNEIKENGENLIMEYKHWSRLGENARIFAYLPNAILKSSPEAPSIKLFNALVFTISLIILFIGFYKNKMAVYGFLLILLINLTPFFIYEVYYNENIFALPASAFFIVLGLNFHLISNKMNNIYISLLSIIISAVIIGFFSEIRNEVSMVLISLILISILARNHKILTRIILPILIFIAYTQTRNVIQNYFDNKFEQSKELVAKHKGHVYNGNRIDGHKLWHPVFCGLGDFDDKYGYEWSDKVAYEYAVPILNEKYNLNINYSGKYHTDNYYDEDSLYYVKFDEIPEYEQVVKEKVITDISSDPFWYFKILLKRIIRIFTNTIPVPFVGWLFFPLVFVFIKNKEWLHIKLLVLSLPLTASSFIIYSGKGITYNSLYVYFVIVSIIIYLFYEKDLNYLKEKFSPK